MAFFGLFPTLSNTLTILSLHSSFSHFLFFPLLLSSDVSGLFWSCFHSSFTLCLPPSHAHPPLHSFSISLSLSPSSCPLSLSFHDATYLSVTEISEIRSARQSWGEPILRMPPFFHFSLLFCLSFSCAPSSLIHSAPLAFSPLLSSSLSGFHPVICCAISPRASI